MILGDVGERRYISGINRLSEGQAIGCWLIGDNRLGEKEGDVEGGP